MRHEKSVFKVPGINQGLKRYLGCQKDAEINQLCIVFFFFLIIYLFLAVLGLCCCASFSSIVVSGSYSLVVVCRLLTVVAFLVVEPEV